MSDRSIEEAGGECGEELFARAALAWAVAVAASAFALTCLGSEAAARAVIGGTVGAVVGVLMGQRPT